MAHHPRMMRQSDIFALVVHAISFNGTPGSRTRLLVDYEGALDVDLDSSGIGNGVEAGGSGVRGLEVGGIASRGRHGDGREDEGNINEGKNQTGGILELERTIDVQPRGNGTGVITPTAYISFWPLWNQQLSIYSRSKGTNKKMQTQIQRELQMREDIGVGTGRKFPHAAGHVRRSCIFICGGGMLRYISRSTLRVHHTTK